MVKALALAGVGFALFGGVTAVGLRSLGEHTAATFETINRALTPPKKTANARDVADWIETYRPGASRARCRKGTHGWDYVCTFRESDGRRVKLGALVAASQPVTMSRIVGIHDRLPEPS